MQASCMAMGQAAGAAAALGVALDRPSRDVPYPQLRALLEEHGAILPPVPEPAAVG
ncbi:MAG: FAD-dependent oxidoreductase [Planctomycetota bacterium]